MQGVSTPGAVDLTWSKFSSVVKQRRKKICKFSKCKTDSVYFLPAHLVQTVTPAVLWRLQRSPADDRQQWHHPHPRSHHRPSPTLRCAVSPLVPPRKHYRPPASQHHHHDGLCVCGGGGGVPRLVKPTSIPYKLKNTYLFFKWHECIVIYKHLLRLP